MKKVGKEFKKTLSAILVAAMVFTSLPQTTLVAKAAEEDPQQTVYDVDDVGGIVENGESKTVTISVTENIDPKLTSAKVEYQITELGAQPSGTWITKEALKDLAAENIGKKLWIKVTKENDTDVVTVDGATAEGNYYSKTIAEGENTISVTITKAAEPVQETATINLPESVKGKYTVTGKSGEVKVGENYTFTVTPADEQTVTVTATKKDGTKVTVTDNGDETYTIDKDQIAKGDVITVAVTAETIKYDVTFNIANVVGDNAATITYTTTDVTTDTPIPGNNKVSAVKDQEIVLKVVPKTVTGKRYDVTVTSSDANATVTDNQNNTYTIKVKKAATINVTVAEKTLQDITFTEGYTVEAAKITKDSKDKDVIGSYTTLSDNKLKDVAPGDEYALKITAKAGKIVNSVSYKETTITPVVVGSDNVYKLTVVAGKNEVTIADAESIELTLTKEGPVTLFYATSDVAYDAEDNTTFLPVPSTGKITVKKDAAIYVHPVVEKHYALTNVKIGDVAQNPTGAGNGNYAITADTTNAGKAITFKAEIIVNAYTFTKTAGLKVTIKAENVQIADSKGEYADATEDIVIDGDDTKASNVTIKVDDGKKVSFKVEPTEKNTSFKSVVAKLGESKVVDYIDGAEYPFQFESLDTDTKTVTFVETALAKSNVTFTDTNSHLASVTITKDGKEGEAQKAFPVTDSNVQEGTEYSFVLAAKQGYKVKEVTADGEVILPKDGAYTLTIKDKAIDVAIATEMDTEQANSVTFTFADATVAITGDSSATIESGKPYYTLGKSVAYTVTAKPGYTVKEISLDGTKVTGTTGGTVTFTNDIASDKDAAKESKAVVVTTEAGKLSAEQYIKVPDATENNKFTFAFKGLEPVESELKNCKVYKLEKDATEIEFTATVAYGSKATIAVDGVAGAIVTNEPTTDKKTVTYTGKLVASLITGTTAAAPKAITVTVADDTKNVKFNKETEIKYNDTWDFNELYDIPVGTEVIVIVPDGEKLYIKTTDAVTHKDVYTQVKTDINNKYKFTVEKDIEFFVGDTTVVEAAYTFNYKIKDGASGVGDIENLEYTTAQVNYTIARVSDDDGFAGTLSDATIAGDGIKSKVSVVKLDGEGKESETGTATAVVKLDKADAGKKLTITFKAAEKNETTGVSRTVTAGTAVITLKPVSVVALKGLTSGKTVKLDANTVTDYEITVSPEIRTLSDVKVVVADSKSKTTAVFAKNTDNKDVVRVTTPAAEEKAVINVVDVHDEKNILFTFTVESVLPSLKLSKVDSPAQGINEIVLTLTKDKNVKESADGKLFYEVIVTAKDAAAPAGSLNGKAFYFPVTDAASVTAKLQVNTAKADAAAGKYEFASRIVLVKGGVTASAATGEGDNAVYKSAVTPVADSNIIKAGNVVKNTFATKNAYYEDKLGVTKKTTTIYNNGDSQVVAQVKYSKNASYIGDLTAQVYNADNSIATGFTTAIDQISGEVTVTTNNNVKAGKYNLVIYAKGVKKDTVETMYQASAKVPITVAQAITGIGQKPLKLVANSKKDVTYTFKPSVSGGWDQNGKYVTPKTKVTYDLQTYNDNAEKNVTIDAKGKLTIKKGFVVGNDPDDNRFLVTIKAADFKNNTVSTPVWVEVADEILQPAEIYLVKAIYNGNYYEPSDEKLDTNALEVGDKAYVVVKDSKGKDITEYVTLKSSNAKALYVDAWGYVRAEKPGKNITITASTTDGGKKSVKLSKLTVNYKKATNLKMVFWDDDEQNGGDNNTLVATGENSYEYYGTVNPTFYFDLQDIVSDTEVNDVNGEKYSYKLSIKGGKLTQYKNNGYYTGDGRVIATDRVTTITLTDNTNKTKQTITLTNKNFQTAKAPSAKLVSGKVYAGLYDEDGNIVTQKLTYSVNTDCTAVEISPESGVGLDYAWVTDIVDGKFDLYVTPTTAAGTAKISIAYGKRDEVGNFIPATKPGTLSVKINKLSNFKPQTSYTLNLKDSKYINLTGKPADYAINYTEVLNANVKGQPNKFLDYFTLDAANDRLVVTEKLVKEIATVDKTHLTGYVKYNYKAVTGKIVYGEAKITIKIDAKDKKYVASGLTILNKANAYGFSKVTLNKADVKLLAVKAVDSANWKAEIVQNSVNVQGVPTPVNTNTIKLTAVKAPAPGKQKVQVAILPEGSQYTDAAKDGVIVEIPVTVTDAAASKGKVVVKNTKIDLSKAAVPGYDTKAKTGTWTVPIYEGYDYKYAIEGIELKTAEIKDVTGVSAKYVKATTGEIAVAAHIEITVNKNDVKLGSTITVPVELTFADGSAAETVSFKVSVPKKVADMASVKAEIEKYLTSIDKYKAQSDITTKIEKIVADNVIAGVTASTAFAPVTVEEAANGKPAVTSTKVTVTLTDRADSKVTDKVEVTLAQPSEETAEQTAAQAYTALAEKVNLIVDKKSGTEEVQAKQLVVTNATTRFDIRQHMTSAITNDNYMLSIVDFKVVKKATTTETGTITFMYRLVDKNGAIEVSNGVKYVEVTKTIAKITEEAK